MTILDDFWFSKPRIDFELKSYILAGYLQQVYGFFDRKCLFPVRHDLMHHRRQLLDYGAALSGFEATFPKELIGIHGIPPQLQYKNQKIEKGLLEEIEAVVHYALPKVDAAISAADALWTQVQHQVAFEAVGIQPIYEKEGYLLLSVPAGTTAYRYAFHFLKGSDSETAYRSIQTQYVTTYPHQSGIRYHFTQIKRDLSNQATHLPHPAAYALISEREYPLDETLLPLAKQRLWELWNTRDEGNNA